MLFTDKDNAFLKNIKLQTVDIENIKVDILRLDLMHPEISGNKWFKLRYYLEDFEKSGKTTLATFGGAFSNHIAATAAACAQKEIKVVGFIRGEEPSIYSPTLQLAKDMGMQFQYLSREVYKSDKNIVMANYPDYYWIPEGGFGKLGADGASTIWDYIDDPAQYSYVFLPAGSGTTTAGLLQKVSDRQKIMAVSVMKNNFSLLDEILSISDSSDGFELLHDYHFGGYAKKTPELLDFMNQCWRDYGLPLDFVYTGKAFYALYDFIKKHEVNNPKRILFIHTGGLQGNKSLPLDTLSYH